MDQDVTLKSELKSDSQVYGADALTNLITKKKFYVY